MSMWQLACSKTFIETDPGTGGQSGSIATATDTLCGIAAIRQVNGSTLYNEWVYTRNASQQTSRIQFRDLIAAATTFSQTFQYKGDTILLDTTSWMIREPKTGRIQQFFTRVAYAGALYDDIYYTYQYDSNGRLKQKQTYYNQTLTPDYITFYYYNGNNLINCQLFTGDQKQRLLQSKFSYDLTRQIKPWIYLFTDAFHEYPYLPILNFGVYPQNPVTEIQTFLYNVSDDSLKDQWTTRFNGYVFSSDNYTLQVTTSGQSQQGLGFLIGTQRFDYQCW